MDGLTPKQKAFADNYIECGNAAEAYRKAGYKNYKSASVEANKTLNNPKIKKYIKKRTEPTEKKHIATGDEVLEFFTRVMNGEEKDAFGLEVSADTRIKAAIELAKRTCDIKDNKSDRSITIINNIPKPSTTD